MDTSELENMQSFLEATATDDPSELVSRLSVLSSYMARSGRLLADAKRDQDIASAMAFKEQFNKIKDLSPSVAQKYVQTLTAEQNHAVNWLDRINRACVHQSDNLRTQISFIKLEMEMGRKGY